MSVPNALWEKCVSAGVSKLTVYAVGVIHSILVSRQMFGSRGMSQFYPLDVTVFIHALDVLMNLLRKVEGELSIDHLANLLSKVDWLL